MSLSDDWRERHGPKQSGGKVIVYLILLLVIILLIARAGDFSRQFTEIFLTPAAGETEDI
ncbi:hypothetical protein CSA37_03130 [Candidatus Fermentibacteria bacterium]|nr:MAG: hypothetical protein CSA37_03130 [Candidatus Fermentibacteria bacterium]